MYPPGLTIESPAQSSDLFTSDPIVLAEGIPAMVVIGLACPIWSLPMVLSGSLRGAGDTRFPLYVTLIAGWLVRVPIGYVAGIVLGFGLAGVYIGVFADALIGASMVLWRYRQGHWRTIQVG